MKRQAKPELLVGPPKELQPGILEYLVDEAGSNPRHEGFTVTFYPSATHRDGGRGYCDWCETVTGSCRKSAGCAHVRAVKAARRKQAAPG